jgi:hypothetical protein
MIFTRVERNPLFTSQSAGKMMSKTKRPVMILCVLSRLLIFTLGLTCRISLMGGVGAGKSTVRCLLSAKT